MRETFVQTSLGNVAVLSLGSGPTALFLHGAIATPRAYLPLLRRLADHMTVVAPTHPGHGNSFAIPDDFTVLRYRDVYVELLKELHVTPRYLIGHSFGGMLALLLAADFPRSTVVVFDSCGLPLSITVREYLSFMTNETTNLLKLRPDLDTLKEAVPAVGTLVSTVVRHPEDLSWFSQHISEFDISDTLRTLHNHVHLVWGKQDTIVPVRAAEKMKELIPNATLTVLDNAGHVYPVTDTGRTYTIIADALTLPR